MRTKEYDFEVAVSTARCVDWKDSPMQVLQQVDELLQHHGLEIVHHETDDDSYIFTVEARQ